MQLSPHELSTMLRGIADDIEADVAGRKIGGWRGEQFFHTERVLDDDGKVLDAKYQGLSVVLQSGPGATMDDLCQRIVNARAEAG